MVLVNAPVKAQLKYYAANFRIIKHGNFVKCAVSGKRIELDDLKYWNVERQEPYAGIEESLKRELALAAQRLA